MAGRVQGAYKTGKMWLMPLFNGKPIIKRGTRGPAPGWRNPKTPAKTIIHVNSHKIRENQKQSTKQPVITVKKRLNSGNVSLPTLNPSTEAQENADSVARKGNEINLYGHEVEILGGCRVVYRPDRSKYGAKVWIETLYEVIVSCWD